MRQPSANKGNFRATRWQCLVRIRPRNCLQSSSVRAVFSAPNLHSPPTIVSRRPADPRRIQISNEWREGFADNGRPNFLRVAWQGGEESDTQQPQTSRKDLSSSLGTVEGKGRTLGAEPRRDSLFKGQEVTLFSLFSFSFSSLLSSGGCARYVN